MLRLLYIPINTVSLRKPLKPTRILCSCRQLSTEPVADLTHQQIAGRKRFYKHVGVTESTNYSYQITLDGRTLRTPARKLLTLPNVELAMAIALEWDAQTDPKRGIVPASMPLMTIASTAIDQIESNPEMPRTTCLSYIPTDTALFLGDPKERKLIKDQTTTFNPIISWLNREFKVVLRTSQTVNGRITHPEEAVQRLRKILESLDHFSLACLQRLTMECKSLVLALAVLCRKMSAEDAIRAARLEELIQTEIWGEVEGGHDMDRLNLSVGLCSAQTFMTLLWDQDRLDAVTSTWKSF